MKYSAVLSALALAATATAVPADIEARTGGGGGGGGGGGVKACNASSQKQVCCNGILSCLVQVIGDSCSTKAYCCKTDAPVGSLINLTLLNCVSIL